jgi:hypothetical protein
MDSLEIKGMLMSASTYEGVCLGGEGVPMIPQRRN